MRRLIVKNEKHTKENHTTEAPQATHIYTHSMHRGCDSGREEVTPHRNAALYRSM